MPVHRTDVLKAEILEHVAAVVDRVLYQSLCGADSFLQLVADYRDRREHGFHMLLGAIILPRGTYMRKVPCQRAGALGNGHSVVVQDYHQRRTALARVVQPLVRHSAGERAVAYDCGNAAVLTLQPHGAGNTVRGRNGRAAVP